MSETDSLASVLGGVREGDGADIGRLWDRYFDRLVRLVAARLPRQIRRAYDAEDVALSAFHSFCARAGEGQFAAVEDRDDLWRLLSTIAARKACALIRHQSRAKRGGGRVLGESALIATDLRSDAGLARFTDREPTPAEAAAFADDYARLFDTLTDPVLKRVALLRLEGHSVEEIAATLDVAPRTVNRKLQVIRSLWEREGLG